MLCLLWLLLLVVAVPDSWDTSQPGKGVLLHCARTHLQVQPLLTSSPYPLVPALSPLPTACVSPLPNDVAAARRSCCSASRHSWLDRWALLLLLLWAAPYS
jgi:hypothetical protein